MTSDAPAVCRYVVATRASQDAFYSATATGQSLRMMNVPEAQQRIFCNNTRGLPELYNQVIDEPGAGQDDILVFVHDDVWLLDFYLPYRLSEGLAAFEIIGVAGNRRRLNRQPAWIFKDMDFTVEEARFLSGVVACGKTWPPETLIQHGAPRQAVRMLDGMFLAARRSTFFERELRFDTRFDFHFYDLDLCRQAEQKGVSMGTWDISVVHQSEGGYANQTFTTLFEKYTEKWKN